MKRTVAFLLLILVCTPAHALLKPRSGSTSLAATGSTTTQVSTSNVFYKTLTVCAKLANSGTVVIGGSDVVATPSTVKGIQLNAGDCISYGDPASARSGNLSMHYMDGTVVNDGVTYEYTIDV